MTSYVDPRDLDDPRILGRRGRPPKDNPFFHVQDIPEEWKKEILYVKHGLNTLLGSRCTEGDWTTRIQSFRDRLYMLDMERAKNRRRYKAWHKFASKRVPTPIQNRIVWSRRFRSMRVAYAMRLIRWSARFYAWAYFRDNMLDMAHDPRGLAYYAISHVKEKLLNHVFSLENADHADNHNEIDCAPPSDDPWDPFFITYHDPTEDVIWDLRRELAALWDEWLPRMVAQGFPIGTMDDEDAARETVVFPDDYLDRHGLRPACERGYPPRLSDIQRMFALRLQAVRVTEEDDRENPGAGKARVADVGTGIEKSSFLLFDEHAKERKAELHLRAFKRRKGYDHTADIPLGKIKWQQARYFCDFELPPGAGWPYPEWGHSIETIAYRFRVSRDFVQKLFDNVACRYIGRPHLWEPVSIFIPQKKDPEFYDPEKAEWYNEVKRRNKL